jgi:hypothetical protein
VQVVSGAQVAPQRESVLGNARVNVAVPHPSQEVMARQVVAKSTPPPAPVSFAAKQQMLQSNQGRPLAPEQVQQIRAQQPAAMVNRAPVRMNSTPAAPPPPPSVNRMDSRPPAARPVTPMAAPVPAPQTQQQVSRPAEVQRPAVEAQRPAAQSRPAPAEDKKATAKPKAKDKKDEKKQP